MAAGDVVLNRETKAGADVVVVRHVKGVAERAACTPHIDGRGGILGGGFAVFDPLFEGMRRQTRFRASWKWFGKRGHGAMECDGVGN